MGDLSSLRSRCFLRSRFSRGSLAVALVLMLVMVGLANAQWVPFSPPDSLPDRATHALAYDPVNDRIYMIGGTPTGILGTHVGLCQRYDPVADTWTTMASMLTPRGWIGAVCVRGRLYVAGGYSNTGDALAVNEEYTIATNTWVTRAPLPMVTFAYMEGVWRDSLIYIMGGMDGNYNSRTTVCIYDPASDSWTTGTPMLEVGDMGGPAAVVGDTIYIASAYNRHQGQIWPYMMKGAINPGAPTQIAWTWGPQIPGRGGVPGPSPYGNTVSLGDKVYGFGHFGSLTVTGDVYDPATGAYAESIPSLLLYGVQALRGPSIVARDREGTGRGLYQVAGTWTSEGGSRYHGLLLDPQGIGDAGSKLTPAGTLSASTLHSNGARIQYETARPCQVALAVYDQSGRVVQTLASGHMQTGTYSAVWDGRYESGRLAGSGVYFCRLQAGDYLATEKLLLMR